MICRASKYLSIPKDSDDPHNPIVIEVRLSDLPIDSSVADLFFVIIKSRRSIKVNTVKIINHIFELVWLIT